MNARIDHLVIAAASLDEGVRWCQDRLGVVPEPGGRHAFMGTHNRLLRLGGPGVDRCYLEIIAIDPDAPGPSQGTRRWFDLDDEALQARLREDGPRLVHFVAAVPDAGRALKSLASLRIDRGALVEASRDTPAGVLHWRITIRADGQRLFYGALPTLIEWGSVHPSSQLPSSAIEMLGLRLQHPRAADLAEALAAVGFDAGALQVQAGPPGLQARLRTPKGEVLLDSDGA